MCSPFHQADGAFRRPHRGRRLTALRGTPLEPTVKRLLAALLAASKWPQVGGCTLAERKLAAISQYSRKTCIQAYSLQSHSHTWPGPSESKTSWLPRLGPGPWQPLSLCRFAERCRALFGGHFEGAFCWDGGAGPVLAGLQSKTAMLKTAASVCGGLHRESSGSPRLAASSFGHLPNVLAMPFIQVQPGPPIFGTALASGSSRRGCAAA